MVLHDMIQGTVFGAVVLYIDDLYIIGNKGLIGQIKDHMKMRFGMHNLRSFSFCLGIDIQCNREHHMVDIQQHSYIWMILAKFRMDQSRPVAMPMEMRHHKRKPDEDTCNLTIY